MYESKPFLNLVQNLKQIYPQVFLKKSHSERNSQWYANEKDFITGLLTLLMYYTNRLYIDVMNSKMLYITQIT